MMDANLHHHFNSLKNFSPRDLEALQRRQIRKYRRLLADEIARAEAGNLMTRPRAEQLLMHQHLIFTTHVQREIAMTL